MTIQDDAQKMMFEDLQSIPALKAENERLLAALDAATADKQECLLANNAKEMKILKLQAELTEWKKTADMVTERDMQIEQLRAVEKAATELVNECRGDLSPSFGVLEKLESAIAVARAALEDKK